MNKRNNVNRTNYLADPSVFVTIYKDVIIIKQILQTGILEQGPFPSNKPCNSIHNERVSTFVSVNETM